MAFSTRWVKKTVFRIFSVKYPVR